jgi:hypothetical protein
MSSTLFSVPPTLNMLVVPYKCPESACQGHKKLDFGLALNPQSGKNKPLIMSFLIYEHSIFIHLLIFPLVFLNNDLFLCI